MILAVEQENMVECQRKMKIKYYLIGILLFTLGFTQEVNLYRVNIEGNTTTSDKMIKYSAGLRDGTKIQRADISTALTLSLIHI